MHSFINFFLIVILVWSTASEYLPFMNDLYPSNIDQLPNDTVPESYTLTVETIFEKQNFLFTGCVNITIRVETTTSMIVLNAYDLEIYEIKVNDELSSREIKLESWECKKNQDLLKININGHILANRKYIVQIWFSGLFRDDGTGFFKTFYTSNSGEKKWLVATQFKATNARSAFPCYDEPRFRTPFNIAIKTKRNEIALANMPISNITNINETMEGQTIEYTWVHFKETPPIPTFLVAYFVGEYENLKTDHQNAIKVYSHLGSLYQIENINNVVSSLLKTMTSCTDIEYTLPKLDLLALPELSLGATENWGLNIYREELLFIDSKTKTKTKMSVKMIVERIMANQWFGNLVTPAKWNYVWLNEGFATYFEYFNTATLEPEWCLDNFFVVEKLQTALEFYQTLRYSINASVYITNKIDGIFDRISRNKGASILRMLSDWVGETAFKKALNLYLTKNRYKAVKPETLWDAFDNVLFEQKSTNLHNENVNTVMKTWTEQIGYPVVNIVKEKNTLILTQKRFSIVTSNENDTTKWFISTDFITNNSINVDTNSVQSVWLSPATSETRVSIHNNVSWYIFNVQLMGFYRVNYAEDNWASLIKQLNDSPTDIHVNNRAQLIDDSFNLARAGQLNYTVPLKLTQYLYNENDVIPWFSLMNNLNYILDRMRRSEAGYADVKAFVGKLAGTAYEKANRLVGELHDDPPYPVRVGLDAFSAWACKLDDSGCVRMALDYFRRWKNGEEIPADVKDAAFCTGIRRGAGGQADVDRMLRLYESTKTYSEKRSALGALACTDDEQSIVANLVLLTLENKFPIERNDYEVYFDALSSTPNGIAALIFFLKNYSKQIIDNKKDGENLITIIYSILAPRVSTEKETKKMFEIAHATTIPNTLKNTLCTIYDVEVENNKKWFEVNSIMIRECIKPGSTTIPETTPSNTTQHPSGNESSTSSRLKSCVILLQVLVLWVPVKLFVHII